MKVLFFTLLLAFASNSFAQQQTPFDTLREAFHFAEAPATLDDFEESLWKGCLYADIAAPMYTRDSRVRIVEHPNNGRDQGPLFPGGDRRVDVFSDYSIDQRMDSFFSYSFVEETPNYFLQSLRGGGWNNVNIYGKTQDDMLFYSVELSNHPQAPLMTRVYGYCWKDSSQYDDRDGEIPLPKPGLTQ